LDLPAIVGGDTLQEFAFWLRYVLSSNTRYGEMGPFLCGQEVKFNDLPTDNIEKAPWRAFSHVI